MKGEYYQALSAKEFMDKGEIALCVDVRPPIFACYGNRIKLRREDGFEYWDHEYNGLKKVIGDKHGLDRDNSHTDACEEVQQATFDYFTAPAVDGVQPD